MSDEKRTYTLAVVPEFHDGKQPEDETDRITWETLDTVWNILRESAVRITLKDIRAKLEAAGFDGMPSDDELFAKAATDPDPDLPKNYLELAPDMDDSPVVDLAAQGLFAAFRVLVDQTYADAVEGLGMAGIDLEGGDR